MDEIRQDFLARAALPEDQDRDVEAGGAFDLLPNRLHGSGRTEVDMVRRQLGLIHRRFRLQ